MPRVGTILHGEMCQDAATPGGEWLPRCAPYADETPRSWHELARATTACGDELVLRERAGTFEIRCNGWDLMSNRAHYSEQWMARMACEELPTDAPRVLIGGLGMGFTLRAALDVLPPAADIVAAELLPEIIAWNRGMLAPLADRPLDDARVSVACADVAELLQPDSFDVIVLDVDNGPGAVMLRGNVSLYTPAGLRRMQCALRQGGVLAIWSASPSPLFEQILREAGLYWNRTEIPARGTEGDPLHSIYRAGRVVARCGARTQPDSNL
jgi:spermidine synthase